MLAQSLKPVTPAIPAHFSLADISIPLNMLPTAEREHYPLVKYWYRREWNITESNLVGAGAHGKARAAQGENVTLRFIEDENGSIIDGFRASAMRRFARELWAGLNRVGKAPKSWGKVDAAVAAQYRNEMERKFSELRLCDNNWKADFIATLNYPSWYNNNVEKEENLKRTSVDLPPDAKKSRVPFNRIDSQLPEVPVSLLFLQFLNALIHLQSSQDFLETPGDESQSPTERDPPVESLGSKDRSRPESRVSFHIEIS